MAVGSRCWTRPWQAEGAAVLLAELRGRRLVLMANDEHNARELLEAVDAVDAVVEPESMPSEGIWETVPATWPAADEMLDEIANEWNSRPAPPGAAAPGPSAGRRPQRLTSTNVGAAAD